MTTDSHAGWRNWSGLEQARLSRIEYPNSEDAVVAAIRGAREAGSTVKMTGAGHSFSPIARPDDVLLRPDRLRGVVAVDRERRQVTALAGTPLSTLNAVGARMGLCLHNMGDIEEQTVAGAISTGTHGTGGRVASLAAQVAALTLVSGTGEVLRCSERENAEILAAARLGLGALGVITTVTFQMEPLFLLGADERPMQWEEALASYDELADGADHLDLYWFPHTDRTLVKSNTRLDRDVEFAEPPSRFAAWREDEFVANTLFGLLTTSANRAPSLIPRMNQIAGRALSARRYCDIAPRVFTSPRRVRFREMEYAVPRAAGLDVLRECRRMIDQRRWRISFPVEIRTAPADDIPLSTASERESLYLAFHVHHKADHRDYFNGIEPILRAAGGRPHWGKLHSMRSEDLRQSYPRFEEFLSLRDRLDPDRVFANQHLASVLGR